MEEQFDLQKYLNDGVQKILKDTARAVFSHPRESFFLAGFAGAVSRAADLRRSYAEKGTHIPAFLIASITGSCNLYCKGCYARATKMCSEENPEEMDAAQWAAVFSQAQELGISFVLLAGGEPLLRPEVLQAAARHKDIVFPVFTNGLLLDTYLDLFDEERNLIPIISIEGQARATDERRGAGTYETILRLMGKLQARGVLFGTSVTVTKENLREVTGDLFLRNLEERGCKLILYIEYVPMDETSQALVLTEEDRSYLEEQLHGLRTKPNSKMVYISFPGDEMSSGGCLAAGRGFFHINPKGGAEPCPFSPYSDISIKEASLLEALNSRLFVELKEGGLLTVPHSGGCVLFQQEERVKHILYTDKS